MRGFISVLPIVAILQGCGTISREAGYPGGNVDYVADRYTLFAQGHDQQVNRYLVSLSLIAPLIAETVQSPNKAKLSAERIKDLFKSIEKLEDASKECALPNLPKKGIVKQIEFEACYSTKAGNPLGSAFSFESLSFEVNKSLNDALKKAFHNLDVRTNVSKVLALNR